MATWTVDIESDWGGRNETTEGIRRGLPILLETFRTFGIRATFFISTEVLQTHSEIIKRLRDESHQIASHGHFHIVYKDRWRWEEDRRISEEILKKYEPILKEPIRYRAPWFNRKVSGEFYSDRKRHVSILKQAWFGGRLPNDPIFYVHPFDIIGGNKAPSIYTRILYGCPNSVLDTFKRLCRLYPGKAMEQTIKSS